ncbi:MAG: ATP-binding protein [Desulfuromonadaceae bacterium]|nr:ATP-binding protein [Desulfuromonadaceae bacterium]
MKNNENAPSSSPSAQLMAIEVISELLVSTSPHKLGEALTGHLRELSGAKTVMVLAHRLESATDELLHVSPLRRAGLFSPQELGVFSFAKNPEELPLLPDELPAAHPLKSILLDAGIQSMARFPLHAGGGLVGLLLFFDLPGVDRIAEIKHIVNLLAPPIGLALKNALAFQQIEQLTRELERRVEERTAELQESQAFFQTAINSSPIPIMIHNEDDEVLQLSKGWTDLSGYTPEDIPTLADWTERAYGERAGSKKEYIDNLFNIYQTIHNGEWLVTAKDGSIRIWDFQSTPLGTIRGGKRVLLSMATDITERKRTERELQEREYELEEAQFLAGTGSWTYDPVTRKFLWSKGMFHIWGLDPTRGLFPVEDFQKYIHPDDYPQFDAALHEALEHGIPYNLELRINRPDDSERTIITICDPQCDTAGTVVKLRGTNQDITERKRAEEEKTKLESQLQQSQKMESIGRLAGGVAHDFNNMLTVILGHAQLGLMHLEPTNRVCADLKEISKSAERSAELTRQLLAFARKQTVEPKVLDLNITVMEMFKMLQRLIGEDIHIVWQPAPELWKVKIDPSQIDQILVNLCVNARDAIDGTGWITIEIENSTIDMEYCAANLEATPGEYIRLTVSDDGGGMDKETLVHIFEPFYTTKELGKGTGLGLPTVYGIVKQNNGFINLYSEPGQGTTFSIYLPRYEEGVSGKMPEAEVTKLLLRGHETILLVEDEPAILNITALMLEKQGYNVLAAHSPGEAIQMARVHVGDIMLLMTDVIMPEMDGRELANNILLLYPHIKRLFMSGYTADVITHHGVLEEGACFIQKPFTLPDIAAKVREILDRK